MFFLKNKKNKAHLYPSRYRLNKQLIKRELILNKSLIIDNIMRFLFKITIVIIEL